MSAAEQPLRVDPITLSVIWGCAGFEERLTETERWYRDLLAQVGATTDSVEPERSGA